MKWIRTKDALPEVNDIVLALNSYDCYELAWIDNEGKWYSEELIFEDGEIAYWMPLPQLPEVNPFQLSADILKEHEPDQWNDDDYDNGTYHQWLEDIKLLEELAKEYTREE